MLLLAMMLARELNGEWNTNIFLVIRLYQTAIFSEIKTAENGLKTADFESHEINSLSSIP